MTSKIRSFLAELRRRRVYHVAVAYVVVGLGVLGAAEVVLDPLGLSAARPFIVILTLAGFPIALVLGWAYEVRPEEPGGADPVEAELGHAEDAPASSDVTAPDVEAASAKDRRGSIVVLPFANLSPEPDTEYFADGMTEEIINALADVPDLRVIARTSAFAFKGTNQDVREIGARLGVRTVLEGSVRRAGERLRITAQLVDASDGHHLWSERYDRELEDVFAIQDEIAGTIAERLKPGGTDPGWGERSPAPSMARDRPTEDLDAYEAFLRGRFHFAKGSLEDYAKSVEHYEQAVSLDPEFAEAHAGMAETSMAWEFLVESADRKDRARRAARKALELDDTLADAHAILGAIRFWYDWEWSGAIESFERALELNPESPMALRLYSEPLAWLGSSGAVTHARRAAALDPFSAETNRVIALALLAASEVDESLEYARKAVELGPDSIFAQIALAMALLNGGSLHEAESAYKQILAAVPDDPNVTSGLVITCVRLGKREEALELTRKLEDRAEVGQAHAAAATAWSHAALGETDEAFQWIERAIEARDIMVVSLPAFFTWDPLRSDPRFEEVLRRLDFPEWSYEQAITHDAGSA